MLAGQPYSKAVPLAMPKPGELAAGVAVTRRAPGLPVTESVEHSTPNWYKYVDVRPRMRVTTESPGHWYRNTVLPMDDPTTPTSVAPMTVAL